MKIRAVLTLTGIVSALLGALVVYLVLSVPNDIRADGLLKQARTDMTEGKSEEARAALSQIVQHYPRTDAAAAATVALLTLTHNERNELAGALTMLRKQNEEQSKLIADLQKRVASVQAAASAKPAPQVQGPPKPPEKKVTPAKKPTPKKKTTTRRRRR